MDLKSLYTFLLLSLFSFCGVDGATRSVAVQLANKLPEHTESLVFHCYAKLKGTGQDFGTRKLDYGHIFLWRFDSDDAKPLVYQCDLSWRGKRDKINAFISSWRDHHIFNYIIKEDGIYANYDTDNIAVGLTKIANW